MSDEIAALRQQIANLTARADRYDRTANSPPRSRREEAKAELERAKRDEPRLKSLATYGADVTKIPPGEIREVVSEDQTGRKIHSFHGDPAAVWGRFGGYARRAAFSQGVINRLPVGRPEPR